MDLNTIWFLLVGVLFTGYAILDGFDLGMGPLLLAVKTDEERRIFLNAIGPIWSGNEVWLVTGGGALFAAFPEVYATVFSGFYDAFMLLLFALIFRAVAIEFRGQRPEAGWRRMWDTAFAIGSVASAMLIGVALGNIVWGIPLDSRHDFQGNFFTLLHPYALFVGITTVALFVMHANLYLVLKTEGPLQQKLMGWTKLTVPAYLVLFVALNVVTIIYCPHIKPIIEQRWLLLGTAHLLALAVTLNILREVRRNRDGRAFICSSLSIVILMLQFGAAVYPNMVFSTPDLANSLNIHNAAATTKSLQFMFYVAMIGVPIVLAYTASIYYIFRGKVVLTEESY
ncbi:cytochrome D oxidase subunit I [Verrucomicrobia bacterium SCGC AG-212-E04]|nr:cytochrome D oxidase subunit I [Verrucomicrobia bacterium SCGC AG-212-E04]